MARKKAPSNSPPTPFVGFPPGKPNWTPVPVSFFSDLLPLIDDLAELKVLLFYFRALPQLEGEFAYLRRHNFTNDNALMQGLIATAPDPTAADPGALLDAALARAVERGALLEACARDETLYFLNTERGRAAIAQFNAGKWHPGDSENPVEILPETPNIYQLYHENFGPMTPLIADELKDFEKTFPADWIEEAMRLAVQKEARHLRFVRAVLERWSKEGKNHASSRQGIGQDPESYVSGKYADFIES